MKWIGVAVLVVIAIGCVVFGLLAGADAQGRGGQWMLALWGAAVVAAGAAIALAVSA
jgi:hypothetical protein